MAQSAVLLGDFLFEIIFELIEALLPFSQVRCLLKVELPCLRLAFIHSILQITDFSILRLNGLLVFLDARFIVLFNPVLRNGRRLGNDLGALVY